LTEQNNSHGKVALVDLDGMIYACAAIAETVYYTVDGVRFDFKKEANEYCDGAGRPRSDIERQVSAQPVSHAINALKMTVEAAVTEAGCASAELYLSPTGQNSFRFRIYPDYKANRAELIKPTHYKALREYAVKHLGAIVADDVEADDMLTIRANELGIDNWVFITNDKDLGQTPGKHYNWSKKTTKDVSRHEAMYCLYMQVLTGDSIDNIKGCPGIGPAKAAHAMRDAADDDEMLEVCKWLYTQAYNGDEEYAMKDLKLNIQLVRMLQRRPT
jgi:quinol monooxygenase YgiN